MLQHYIITALRNFWQNKPSTIIALIGMAVGIACAFLLFLFIQSEMNENFEGRDNPRVLLQGILSAAGLMIVSIACLNLMNLLIASFTNRIKEVGVRKTFGAGRQHVLIQFLVEAFVLCTLSLPLALALTEMTLPHFNTLIGRELTLRIDQNLGFGIMILVLPCAVGMLAGSYPALLLSSFQPVTILKGIQRVVAKSLRKVLIVAQFVIAICLLIGCLLIFQEAASFQHNAMSVTEELFPQQQLDVLRETAFIATVLGLFISFLGLFGLAGYETSRRIKEVGIRKALGATSVQIVGSFLKHFLGLVMIANVIAWPLFVVGFRFVMNALEYPHSVHVGMTIFLRAGLISLLLTIATVGIQTVRTALTNPVNVLRYE
jgi:ABC-type antimicrobial peptide transport system permease subunit